MNYQDIIQKWGEIPDRNKMSFEDEFEYVQDWYDAGNTLPTKPFETSFSDYTKYNLQTFTIIGPVSYVEDDVDIEVLPLWKIRFDANSDIIWATCNEIFAFEK